MNLDIRTNRFDGRGITLEQLRAFVSVAKHSGFAKAGEELGRTQSTLSLSIKRLEEVIGCRLIDRRPGYIVGLTDEGKQLLPAAKDILFRMTQALQSVKKHYLRGNIRLGIPNDFNIENLHEIISQFLAKHPELKIEIAAASSPVLSSLLEEQQLDIAIIKEMAGQPNNTHNKKVLSIEQLYWVASKPEYFNNIEEIPLVTFPEGYAIRECAITGLEHVDKPYFFSYVSASLENIKSAVKHNFGITLLPYNELSGDLYVLSTEHDIPSLPDIQIALHVVAHGELYTRFADHLHYSLSE